jgi:hypothetical protein
MDCFLCLRGTKTLGVRMQRHDENARELAALLEKHAKVSQVFYPGLASHPQHALAKRQASGFGGMIPVRARGWLARGGPRGVQPLRSVHARREPRRRREPRLPSGVHDARLGAARATPRRMGFPDGLLRLSVGIEDVADLARISNRHSMRSELRAGLLAVALGLMTSCAPSSDHRLIVVSTDDVQGKTSPCGCHTPKGGLARRATFLDSVRTKHRDVLVVDAGNFFPATEDEREAGPFMLASMARLGTQVAGVGGNDLRFGTSFLHEHARAAGVPLVSTNLVRFDTGIPAFEGWRMEQYVTERSTLTVNHRLTISS